ncbi:hypothetical protein Ahy_A05g024768 isoform A [Arachis hypogaea]|uniref:Replication factor A C-terminal domain-containing protein n=1 Tax=Arachis hypogaea TaxID=3818 RepID=A0A445D6L3_ARAHY|nr:hypothetical protein Ahy_A05g024768 isoform A [Arachis hypogaea]
MVVQLFKSNIYLSSINIQSTYYVSRCYFNPNLPEVIDFKKRYPFLSMILMYVNFFCHMHILAMDFVPCSQRISQLETQTQYSVIDEINADIVLVRTIEETYPKKVAQSKDRRVGFKVMPRYRLQVIMIDGSSCLKLFVWNKEADQMVGKVTEKVKELFVSQIDSSLKKFCHVKYIYAAENGRKESHTLNTWILENMIDKRFLFKLSITYKNINAVDGVYSVIKLSDDESLMSSYGVANPYCDASMLANIPIAEIDENSNGHVVVSLSRSNGASSYQTPAKRTSPDAADDSTVETALLLDVQASANKTFKRNCGRKKIG